MAPGSHSEVLRMKAEVAYPEFIKAFLEAVSEKLLHSWDGTNGSDNYDIQREYCTADFTVEYFPSEFEYPWPGTKTLEAHLKMLTKLKRVNPSWKMRPFNFTTVLDRELKHAVVWFTSGPSGGPGSPGEWSSNRESISRFKWRKRKIDGQWECYGHVAMRGGISLGDLDQTICAT